MLVMRGMGANRQRTISVQVFPYGDNRKLILTQDITELERTDSCGGTLWLTYRTSCRRL